MKFKTLPSQTQLCRILDYDDVSGIFTWKYRPEYGALWNTRFCGKVAGQPHPHGYWNITVDGCVYRAHRLAWVYFYGDVLDQDTEVDHKNRRKSDNQINNLRLATKSQNAANGIGKSRSGLPKGVERNKARFIARIMINRSRRCLGTYDTPEEAHVAYMRALNKAYGEFARSE